MASSMDGPKKEWVDKAEEETFDACSNQLPICVIEIYKPTIILFYIHIPMLIFFYTAR